MSRRRKKHEGHYGQETFNDTVKGPTTEVHASNTLNNADHVISRATEVIGDRDIALQWLGTPVRELNYSTPVSLLEHLEGQQAVLLVLDNLQHGAF